MRGRATPRACRSTARYPAGLLPYMESPCGPLVPLILWEIVLRAARHAVLIRAVEDFRRRLEVAVRERWRGRRRPFQRGRFPGVRADRLPFPDAPEEIEDERNLEQ